MDAEWKRAVSGRQKVNCIRAMYEQGDRAKKEQNAGNSPSEASRAEGATIHGKKVVGAVRFELTTSCTRNKRASQATLRPEPPGEVARCGAELQLVFCKEFDRQS